MMQLLMLAEDVVVPAVAAAVAVAVTRQRRLHIAGVVSFLL
jgi:hypothetical protein